MNVPPTSFDPTKHLHEVARGSAAAGSRKGNIAYWRAFPGTFASITASMLVFYSIGSSADANAGDAPPVKPSAFVSGTRPNDAGMPISTVTQPLPGPLFFTPDQRARIDSARKRGVVVLDEEVPEVIAPPVMNGFLRRSDGQVIAWIDGKVHWVTGSPGSQQLVPNMIGEPSAVTIRQSGVEPSTAVIPIVPPLVLSNTKSPKRGER